MELRDRFVELDPLLFWRRAVNLRTRQLELPRPPWMPAGHRSCCVDGGWILADDSAAVVKQVKEANDIVAVVGSYVALSPAGKTFKGLCPFHNDSRPSFTVDPHWQNYRCWSCGKFGDVIQFVQEFEKVGFRGSAGTAGPAGRHHAAAAGPSENLEAALNA